MSFLSIKDPDERDEQIAEYIALEQRLKERDLEGRGDYMDRRRELQENFEPVVSSNQKMAEDITSELKEIRQNISNVKRGILTHSLESTFWWHN